MSQTDTGPGEKSEDAAMAERRKKRPRIARWQNAVAVVPLALLAGAWSADLGSSPSATADSASTDPGVPAVPTSAFDQPASYTRPAGPAVTGDRGRPPLDPTDPSSVSAGGIPTAALTAYRRAETVMAEADPGCHLPWALVAAIGRVESDHGRDGGSVLLSDGVARPGIFGVPLDGSHGVARIADTDGGSLDHDTAYDRAVGPMQFVPSTWKIVGVDADGDGVANPQDIDDAALATAVYLCAGTQDLSTVAGRRSAVLSYNHSQQYVDLVLAIAKAYQDGDWSEVPDGLPRSPFIPVKLVPDGSPRRGHDTRPGPHRQHAPRQPQPDRPDSPSSPPSSPAPGPSGPGPNGGDDPTTPTDPSTSAPSTPTLPDPTAVEQQVVLTVQQAKSMCVDKLSQFEPLTTGAMITGCTQVLTGLTKDQATQKLAGSTLAAVLTNLGLASLIPSLPASTPCLPVVCSN